MLPLKPPIPLCRNVLAARALSVTVSGVQMPFW